MSAQLETFGPFKLLRLLGRGGQANLYLASDMRSNIEAHQAKKLVVIKRVRATSQDLSLANDLLINEGLILSMIRDKGIVRLLSQGQIEQQHYLCLEYIDGLNLDELLHKGGPLPPLLAVWISREICASLQVLHALKDAQGRAMDLVHRDMSPGNLLIARNGDIKICDLGSAHWQQRERKTQSYQVRGTARYLSPEQILGDTVESATDLYALGLLLFYMLYGQHYNSGKSEAEILKFAAQPRWHSPQTRQVMPSGLIELLQRALRAQPERRFANAKTMLQALEQILDAAPPFNGARTLAETIF